MGGMGSSPRSSTTIIKENPPPEPVKPRVIQTINSPQVVEQRKRRVLEEEGQMVRESTMLTPSLPAASYTNSMLGQ